MPASTGANPCVTIGMNSEPVKTRPRSAMLWIRWILSATSPKTTLKFLCLSAPTLERFKRTQTTAAQLEQSAAETTRAMLRMVNEAAAWATAESKREGARTTTTSPEEAIITMIEATPLIADGDTIGRSSTAARLIAGAIPTTIVEITTEMLEETAVATTHVAETELVTELETIQEKDREIFTAKEGALAPVVAAMIA